MNFLNKLTVIKKRAVKAKKFTTSSILTPRPFDSARLAARGTITRYDHVDP